MALQNRVTPFGDLIATPARGTLMGNRGLLHDDRRRIVRYRRGRLWIACRLDFKGRRRPLMAPGRYTELFFLDEATALAAGHRPCFECRRDDAVRFRRSWLAGQGLEEPIGALELDRRLDAERMDGRRRRGPWAAAMGDVPTGAVIAEGGLALLVAPDGRLRPWAPEGWGDPRPAPPPDRAVAVVTPPSIVAAIRRGYAPHLHDSAG